MKKPQKTPVTIRGSTAKSGRKGQAQHSGHLGRKPSVTLGNDATRQLAKDHRTCAKTHLKERGVVRYDRKAKLPSMGLNFPAASIFMADTLSVELDYVDRFAPAPVSGTNFHQVYALNGLYDPDITGTGHQPLWYDTLTTMYNNYIVTHVDVQILVLDNGTSAAPVQFEMGVCPSYDSSDFASSDPEVLSENRYGWAGLMSTHTGNPIDNQYHGRFDLKRLYGLPQHTDLQVYSPSGGSSGSNPSTPWYLHVNGQVIDESTTMANVYIYVRLLYKTRWFLRKVQETQS